MKNWEKALDKFIAPWKAMKEVEGIFLVGSYSTGLAGKNSDIDVQIVLSDKTKWKERGTKVIGGFIVDYSATPYSVIEKFMGQTRGQTKITSRKIGTGAILFDRKGLALKLKRIAIKKLKKKFPKPTKAWVERQKYQLWFGLRELTNLYENSSNCFYYECRLYIKEIIEVYATFKRADVVQSSKTHLCLTDKTFAKKYKVNAFPDPSFNKLLLSCFCAPNSKQKIKRITKLANYAIKRMGGYKVDGWKLRTPAQL